MKKKIVLSILMFVPMIIGAQDSTTIARKNESILNQKDSIIIDHIDHAIMQSGHFLPRYKIYKTENIYHVLKLDTATGRIWQIQIGINDDPSRMVNSINSFSLLSYYDEIKNGRFELYPTGNMYNFVLLDTQRGYTYQVQWHTDPDKRFIVELD